MFANVAAVLIAVAHFVLAQSQTCSRTYTVQTGDICDSISAANNVSTYQLAVVNEGIIDENCDNLVPGNNICLGWEGDDCSTTYVVQDGDDCDIIANNWGINTTMFYSNNPQIDTVACDNLYIGEVVCTASTVIVPPPPASGTLPGSQIPPTATPALPWCD